MIDEELIAKMSADKDAVAEMRRHADYLCSLGGPDLRDCSDEELVRIMLEGAERLREAVMLSGVSVVEAAEAMVCIGRAGISCDALCDALDGFEQALRDLNANPNA